MVTQWTDRRLRRLLHGAYTAQECLKADVLDVIEIQLRPVLLGQGRLLFEGLPPRSHREGESTMSKVICEQSISADGCGGWYRPADGAWDA